MCRDGEEDWLECDRCGKSGHCYQYCPWGKDNQEDKNVCDVCLKESPDSWVCEQCRNDNHCPHKCNVTLPKFSKKILFFLIVALFFYMLDVGSDIKLVYVYFKF